MRNLLFVAGAVWLLGACGGDSSPDARGECTDGCLESGWWLSILADCSVLCMADPSWPECTHADCDTVEARRYDSTNQHSLLMLHTAEARSFHLIGPPMVDPYHVEDCTLHVDISPPRMFGFTCSAGSLSFETSAFTLATSAQAGALDQASQAGVEGSYSY